MRLLWWYLDFPSDDVVVSFWFWSGLLLFRYAFAAIFLWPGISLSIPSVMFSGLVMVSAALIIFGIF